jgi:P27 family predicted phage terminase small subunit
MGARGPVAKTKLKATAPLVTPPPPPDYLSPGGKLAFSHFGALLIERKLLEETDTQTLAILADSISNLREEVERLREEGTVLESGRTGASYQNPRFNIVSILQNKILEVSKRFGLSPVDRARLIEQAEAPGSNPLAEAIARKRN